VILTDFIPVRAVLVVTVNYYKKLSWCWQTRPTRLEVSQSRSPNI